MFNRTLARYCALAYATTFEFVFDATETACILNWRVHFHIDGRKNKKQKKKFTPKNKSTNQEKMMTFNKHILPYFSILVFLHCLPSCQPYRLRCVCVCVCRKFFFFHKLTPKFIFRYFSMKSVCKNLHKSLVKCDNKRLLNFRFHSYDC